MGRIGRKLGGVLIGLGLVITLWSRIPVTGCALAPGGVILARLNLEVRLANQRRRETKAQREDDPPMASLPSGD